MYLHKVHGYVAILAKLRTVKFIPMDEYKYYKVAVLKALLFYDLLMNSIQMKTDCKC